MPDPDGDAYDEMLRQHRASARSNEAEFGVAPQQRARPVTRTPPPKTEIDSIAAGIAQALNGPRKARLELEQGHTGRAALDAATAVYDLAWGGSAARGLLRGKLKLRPPFEWRTKPWTEGRGAREWMGDKGFVEKGQPAHHALIPQKGWGKFVPDAIKNQPANIKPSDTLTHTLIHGASRKFDLPRFNLLERYWHGTPTWWKAANGSVLGHAVQTAWDHLPHADPAKAPPQTNQTKK